ncbi:MAG TPA: Hsp70 family protein [bacterium]|nr:Hsp70 family protein [bacterium]
MSRILGIDLGTSTTSVALVREGKPVVIPAVRGSKVTPSYIYVMDDGRITVGENAKIEAIADPYNTIWATKRLIGRAYKDPHVQECLEKLSYRIVASDKGGVAVQGREKFFSPIKVASLILKYVSRLSANFTGEEPKKAVITVPASFNDLQRKATKQAGENIGLEIIRLVNEPTASALAWGYDKDAESTVAIYDLGGGTFDVSILAIGKGVYEVLATRGDSWLGGEDFDERLVNYVVKMFKSHYQINILNDKMAHQRLKNAAENAKIELSTKESTRIFIPAICPDMDRNADVDYRITRSHFEGMVEDLVKNTIETFERTIADADLEKDELDNIILVGGMTRLPIVRRMIEEFLGRPADYSVDPDLAVAIGAAIHAASLEGEEIALAPPPSLRRKAAGPKAEGPMPPVAAPPPRLPSPGHPGTEWSHEQDAADEPIAMAPAEEPAEEPAGAAEGVKQAAPLLPALKGKAPLLIDVVSQSVGISDMAGLFVPIIPRNTKLPAKLSQVFTTAMDNQEAIRISIYQGEGQYVKNIVLLGEFSLRGIETAARGLPQIIVTFNIDQSGLFTVSAKDLKTNVQKEITVEGAKL